MEKYTPLSEHVERMRAMGEILVEYNFPKRKPAEEDDIAVLKNREIVVDGYELGVSYSKSDFDEYLGETLQVWGRNIPFLPFCLVCKVARRFLGNEHLSLVEIFRENRKVYIWTVTRSREGVPIDSPCKATEYEPQEYEGFRYRLMNPETVNFY